MLMMSMALVFSVSSIAATTHQTKDAKTMTTAEKKGKSSMNKKMMKVNINSADAAALTKIKGIGPKKAKAIVDYRKANGKFKKADDLQKVKGIGAKTLEKIKASLTI